MEHVIDLKFPKKIIVLLLISNGSTYSLQIKNTVHKK